MAIHAIAQNTQTYINTQQPWLTLAYLISIKKVLLVVRFMGEFILYAMAAFL